MSISSRIKSLERSAKDRRGACESCKGAGRPLYIRGVGPERTQTGGPCPSCGRVIEVVYVRKPTAWDRRELPEVPACA